MYTEINSEEKREEFVELSNTLIKWLCDNYHPHTKILITPTNAELMEWLIWNINDEFVKD